MATSHSVRMHRRKEGGREDRKIIGEREGGRERQWERGRKGEREMEGRAGGREGEAKESINKGTCTCTCIT